MTSIDRSWLSFSLNNNPDCRIKGQSASKRLLYIEKGLFSKNKEVLILVNDIYFPNHVEHEVYGHIVKYFDDNLWCACLVLSHKCLNKRLDDSEFLNEYNKQIILEGHWSPMNSISKNDVFIESTSYEEALENMNKIIKNYSNDKNIPIAPSPEEEMADIKVQDGNCDFRLLDLYGINLTYT
jgi:hypothetical protein